MLGGAARVILSRLPRHHSRTFRALPPLGLSLGVPVLLLALSMPFAPSRLSPPGSEASVLRAATDVVISRHALDLEHQGLASNQPELLEEAIHAFAAALAAPGTVVTEAARAWTANQVALAHKNLASIHDGDQQLLKQAIAGYRQALGFYAGTDDRQNAGIVSANLLAAMLELKGKDAAAISGAEVQSLADAALAATDRASAPLVWARLQVQIGTLLLATGARAGNIDAVSRAVEALRSGVEDAQHDGMTPREWAEAENLLGNALEYLGDTKASTDLLHQALQTINNAWVLYQYAGLDQYHFFFDNRVSTLQARITQLAAASGATESASSAAPTGTGAADSQSP